MQAAGIGEAILLAPGSEAEQEGGYGEDGLHAVIDGGGVRGVQEICGCGGVNQPPRPASSRR